MSPMPNRPSRSARPRPRPSARTRPAARPRAWRFRLTRGTGRLRAMLVVMAILVTLCGGRLLTLQAFDTAAYAQKAETRLQRTVTLPAVRGEITDRNGRDLARTEPAVDITADPTLMTLTDEKSGKQPPANFVAAVLAKHLGGDPTGYLRTLTKPDTRHVVVASKVPVATWAAISDDLAAQRVYGLFRESDPIRNYPEKATAAQLVGFLNKAGQGAAGFEYAQQRQLAGVAGKEAYDAAPGGYRIPLGEKVQQPAVDGTNYQLTIDTELQWLAERRLAEAVKEFKADSATAVAMDIKTGQVLAMANAPTFDANDPNSATPETMGNRAVSYAYEPGSVEKVLSMAALLDSGTVTPDTKLSVPPNIKSGDTIIHDVWKHGNVSLTARGAFYHSSNIGLTMMSRRMDKGAFYSYLQKFGLGQRPPFPVPGVAKGRLPGATAPDYTRDQNSFGQGLSVTALQMTSALAGILNGGVHNDPTLIRSATDPSGKPVPVPGPNPRRVVSEKTSREVADLMETVVDPDGRPKSKLAIDGYRTGGKTGTAQKYDPKCGCYNGYTSSYAGVAPVEDPKIVIYVAVQNPRKGDHSGGGTAGPVYQDLMKYALPRYGVTPSTTPRSGGSLTWGGQG